MNIFNNIDDEDFKDDNRNDDDEDTFAVLEMKTLGNVDQSKNNGDDHDDDDGDDDDDDVST